MSLLPDSVPYLARIILSLASILLFQKILRRLDAAMLVGIFILAVWTGHGAASMAGVTAERLLSMDMLLLALVISGVIWLSSLMSAAGIMKDLVVCLKARLRRRQLLMALPAVVGLLPMPAGALFSAPLVEDADDTRLLTPDEKTKINYWFRHVWEFWWPLYPGVLLAVDLTALPVGVFVLTMCPLFFAAIGGGYVFLLRNVPDAAPAARTGQEKPFLPLVLPILTVVAVYGLLLAAAPAAARFNKYLPMVVGVAAGLIVLQIQRPASRAEWTRTVLSRRSLGLVLIIILARLYGAFIEARLADGTLLMEAVRAELDAYGIPALFLIVVIPFVSGLTTGITVGYIGASFPVVLSLAGDGRADLYSTMILGYACGFAGMMLSPIHVCLLVTNEFFKTKVYTSIRGLVLPAATIAVAAAAYAYAWHALG